MASLSKSKKGNNGINKQKFILFETDRQPDKWVDTALVLKRIVATTTASRDKAHHM